MRLISIDRLIMLIDKSTYCCFLNNTQNFSFFKIFYLPDQN